MDLNAYLTPHFRLSEFASKDGSGFPDSVIDDLTKQAQLLEIIREAAGNRPISINSGYRSPAHNRAVHGATHSQHPMGTAADFNVSGMTPRQTTELITGLIDQGRLPSGGLGVYNNWVHYDHRPNGNARWAGDGGPVPARAKVVNNGFAMQPETSGAAPAAFVDAPQGSIPTESAASVASPVFREDIRKQGMDVLQSLMTDLGEHARSFNYADQLKAREAFQQQVMDRYGESQEMGLGDIPGAVIGAPVLALKHLMAPLRRAMGSREQANLDMWGGQGGLDALAAISGDPTIAEKYAETPGAGSWLKSLVTDSQERRANAARAALARMGMYDRKMAEDSKTFLTEATTAAQKANAIQSLLGGLNQTAGTEYDRVLQGQQGAQALAGARENMAQANLADANRAEVPSLADATRYKDTMAGYASQSRGDENYTRLPGLLDVDAARARLLGEQTKRTTASIGREARDAFLKEVRERRLAKKDLFGATKSVLDAAGLGLVDEEAGDALITQFGAPGFSLRNDGWFGDDLKLSYDGTKVIPKTNVGGVDGLASGTVTDNQAAGIQAGESDPSFYTNDEAGKAKLKQAVASGRITKDAGDAVARHYGWIK